MCVFIHMYVHLQCSLQINYLIVKGKVQQNILNSTHFAPLRNVETLKCWGHKTTPIRVYLIFIHVSVYIHIYYEYVCKYSCIVCDVHVYS